MSLILQARLVKLLPPTYTAEADEATSHNLFPYHFSSLVGWQIQTSRRQAGVIHGFIRTVGRVW